jgi:hypothetical protein
VLNITNLAVNCLEACDYDGEQARLLAVRITRLRDDRSRRARAAAGRGAAGSSAA